MREGWSKRTIEACEEQREREEDGVEMGYREGEERERELGEY